MAPKAAPVPPLPLVSHVVWVRIPAIPCLGSCWVSVGSAELVNAFYSFLSLWKFASQCPDLMYGWKQIPGMLSPVAGGQQLPEPVKTWAKRSIPCLSLEFRHLTSALQRQKNSYFWKARLISCRHELWHHHFSKTLRTFPSKWHSQGKSHGRL